MFDLASSPHLSFLLDLVWLADHPGDRVVYRHVSLSPLAEVQWPDGVPAAEAVSAEIARRLSERGLVGTLRDLYGPADENFEKFIRLADEFERTRPIDKSLGDFCQESGLKAPCLT